jgi:DNA adenine methylase
MVNKIMDVPHPIPYQGSKRNIADVILSYFPKDADRLIEPFAGSAAITLAAAAQRKAKYFLINDINSALIDLWKLIINDPECIADSYRHLWVEQKGCDRKFYDEIRDRFNATQRPDYLLYLLARCVKASIRYNSNGEFNQSPDNRRKGTHPDRMRKHIMRTSSLLKEKATLDSVDYWDILKLAAKKDIIYMDPPYQGVCGGRDSRYFKDVSFNEFVNRLYELNEQGLSYILSYDGRNDLKTYGKPLPEALRFKRIEICAGRSTQATLLGHNASTFESLYLSPALLARTRSTPRIESFKRITDYESLAYPHDKTRISKGIS